MDAIQPRLGAYPDFGHMALDGEDLAMGLAMVRQYLAVVGVKDGCQIRREEAEARKPPYIPIFTHVGAGSVDWEQGLGLLLAMGYDGPLSVHTEYQFDEEIIRQVGYAGHKPAAHRSIGCRRCALDQRALIALGADNVRRRQE